jgi:hypothetical protein
VKRKPRGYITRWIVLTGIVAAFFCFTPNVTLAQSNGVPWITKAMQPNGFDVQLPVPPPGSPPKGLQLEVDSRWIDNFGYRPIHVRVTSPQPTTVNHLVTIRLYVGFSQIVSVEQDIEMPLGSTLAEAAIALPQYRDRLNYWWDVWVDGVKRPALSVERGTGLQLYPSNSARGPTGGLKFLTLPAPANSVPPGTVQSSNPGNGMFETLSVAQADLPTRWLDYSCFDVVCLKPKELYLVAQYQPEALAAICRWVRSGGQLWVSPVGNEWEELDDVERLLAHSANAAAETATEEGTTSSKDDEPLTDETVESHGWRPIKIPSPGEAPTITDATTATEEEPVAHSPPTDSLPWYVQKSFGLGYVRAYRKPWDPAGVAWSLQMLNSTAPPSDSQPTPTPLSVALATTRSWESRHGMAPDAPNPDFANLLVPGVGLAPVTEFRVLITMFVLAIGPINYWLLKRWNRPHLMVLTVPITAALVTLALFSYAVLSDGFRSTVRVRSFLSLDQRTGEAACWARLSYYAGLAPSRGLTLPNDVAVYPIIPGWNESTGRTTSGEMRQLEWTAGDERLTQGWLRSRTPTQYLMVRARKTPIRLALTPGAGKLSAKNELDTAIEYVAAIDDEGHVFAGEGLAAGAAADLTPTTREDAVARLRTFVTDNLLVAPPELNDESSSYAVSQRRQRRQFFRSQLGLDYSPERLEDNLMNGEISTLVGLSGDSPLDLPPRSYMAITVTGPEVVSGIPSAVEEASFHVVVGKW